jgi:hypothetical protein
LMITILTGQRRDLNVILTCIPFMAEDIEHFFMYLLAICTSFESCLFNYFNNSFFWCLSFWALYIFWIWILYPRNSWQRFSPIL